MLGIVFTEFLDHVEKDYGFDLVEDMIQGSDVPSAGAYTSVGTYPHSEIVVLVKELSRLSGVPVSDLVCNFGEYLGGRFAEKFESFFVRELDLFDFLESVEGTIHSEVKKLYPDAHPPGLRIIARDERSICLRYRSLRGMDDLAVGLVHASAKYYGEEVSVERNPGVNGEGSYVDITVRKSSTGGDDGS